MSIKCHACVKGVRNVHIQFICQKVGGQFFNYYKNVTFPSLSKFNLFFLIRKFIIILFIFLIKSSFLSLNFRLKILLGPS